MNSYEILYNNIELNKIIDNVNKMNEGKLYVCHGRYHTMNVVNIVEYILRKLKYNEKTIEL